MWSNTPTHFIEPFAEPPEGDCTRFEHRVAVRGEGVDDLVMNSGSRLSACYIEALERVHGERRVAWEEQPDMDDMTEDHKPLSCRLVRAGEPFVGKQGLTYAPGVSAETVGARGIHMQLVHIPPGNRAKAHKHVAHESAIYGISGESGVWHGEKLEQHSVVRPGDFFYIPANMPHLPYNASANETCIAVIARTDPNEQESVELLPELEAMVPQRESNR